MRKSGVRRSWRANNAFHARLTDSAPGAADAPDQTLRYGLTVGDEILKLAESCGVVESGLPDRLLRFAPEKPRRRNEPSERQAHRVKLAPGSLKEKSGFTLRQVVKLAFAGSVMFGNRKSATTRRGAPGACGNTRAQRPRALAPPGGPIRRMPGPPGWVPCYDDWGPREAPSAPPLRRSSHERCPTQDSTSADSHHELRRLRPGAAFAFAESVC